MIKCHHRAGFVRSIINFLGRFGNYGMLDTDYIGLIAHVFSQGLPFKRQVANHTCRAVTPFTMASHALAVKRPFQPRLSEILCFRGNPAVAFATGRDFPGWAVMMAMNASFSHSDHFSVKLMVESNWLI